MVCDLPWFTTGPKRSQVNSKANQNFWYEKLMTAQNLLIILQVNFFHNRIPDNAEFYISVSLSRTIHWYEAREVSQAITFWQFGYVMLCKPWGRHNTFPFRFNFELFFTRNILKPAFCRNLSYASKSPCVVDSMWYFRSVIWFRYKFLFHSISR